MRRAWARLGLAASVLLGTAAACGTDDVDPPPVCEVAADTVCAAACECSATHPSPESDVCYVVAQSATGARVTQGRNPGSGCTAGLDRDLCGDPSKDDRLTQACLDALNEAVCELDPDGRARNRLVLPSACDGILDCGGGPCAE